MLLFNPQQSHQTDTMISDDDLYRLAIFLGSFAMVLIVLYHFFEVNSREDTIAAEKTAPEPAPASSKPPSATK
ncbi:Oligosaccaryltransferase-domain-containing protein [Xylariaceae sp. FL1272]|nr:Oligosaccaryltransferase-domain-containing protein [Xylariaceae sp. FL1272]